MIDDDSAGTSGSENRGASSEPGAAVQRKSQVYVPASVATMATVPSGRPNTTASPRPAVVRMDAERTSRVPSDIGRGIPIRGSRDPATASSVPPMSNESVPVRLPSSASEI